MVQVRNVHLDFQKLAEIGLVGVRRAAAFIALGQRAWVDDTIKSVKINVPIGLQLLPDPLPEALSDEIRANFRIWLCGAAISELIQGLSLFVDECFKVATYVTFKNQRIAQEGLDRINRCSADTNLASKLKRLMDDCGVKCDLLDHADGWARVRNALAHNRGIVRERDCTPGKSNLEISWRQFEFLIDGKKIENIIGHSVEGGAELGIRLGNGSKQFEVGGVIDFTEQEVLHICLTAQIHISNTTAAIEKITRDLIAASKSESNNALTHMSESLTRITMSTAPTHLFASMLSRVHAACASVLGPKADLARVVVEPPRDPTHGDMATNAAMVLAKDAGKKPRELAEAIAEKLRADDLVTKAEVAGAGFINLTLKPHLWAEELRAVLAAGKEYGRSSIGNGEKVNVEYVSANPTGPMHVGHGRGAVFGDALANLLAFAGFDVTREYYINDAGAQVDVLARSAYLRYREALGEDIGPMPEGLYPGDYLVPVGAALAAEHGAKLKDKPESDWLPIVRTKAVAMMMDMICADLAALNVRHDVFFSERSLSEGKTDQVTSTIKSLQASGEVYEGRLPPPKGGNLEDWEDREQTLFRSTSFGDDVDRPLKKSDGSYTYFASDIAYHKSKVDRGFRNMIDVWGADHGGYIKRMQAAVKAVSGGKAELDVKLVQLVRLLRAGEPVKMSKRAGDFVTLREVVDEVGKDAVRFDMLYRKNDAVLDFDLAKVIEKSRENPVFYVQYGHARGESVFRNARETMPGLPAVAKDRAGFLKNAALDRLSDSGELSLLRRIALYPRMVEGAAAAHEPHRVAFYLYELASEFHAQYTRGNDLPHLRFIIQNDPETTLARLALVQGIVTVLASGLALLGVEAPEEMR